MVEAKKQTEIDEATMDATLQIPEISLNSSLGRRVGRPTENKLAANPTERFSSRLNCFSDGTVASFAKRKKILYSQPCPTNHATSHFDEPCVYVNLKACKYLTYVAN